MGMTSIVGKAINASREKIKAFHGSPHSFDRFSTDQIGTGEGAQAYGRGLYFAEREGTAESYKYSTNFADKKRQFQRELPDDADIEEVMEMNAEGVFTPEMTELLDALAEDDFLGFDYPSQAINAALSRNINDYDPSPRLIEAVKSGHMYEVNIDASPDELLDYDLPLSEQSEYVRSRLPQELLDKEDARGITAVKDYPLPNSHMMSKAEYREKSAEALRNSGIKGIKYADAQTRFSPKGKTHNYVVFDDSLVSIAKKYGVTLPVASAILAGTITPQDAEAGALSTVQNLIKLGFLTVDSAANPSAVKSAITKYNKAYSDNPAFRAREILRQDVENNTARLDVGERNIIAPHDLVGKTGVPIMGDATTIADVNAMGGVRFDDPSKFQGGAEFPMQHQDKNLGWASMEGAAVKKQENFNYAAEKTQSDVVGITGRMGDESTNFTSGVAETLLKQVNGLPLRKRDKKAFDDELRKFRPEWVGLDHPDAMDQLFGRNGYPIKGAGKLRSVFSNRMDMSKFRDLGFPTVKEIHDEIMIPALRNANIGDSGFSVIDATPNASTRPIDVHASYDTGIEGKYAGGFEVPIPARVMYPNMFKDHLDLAVDKNGMPLTESQKTGSMVMNPKLYQRLDNQWADGVQDFIDRNKKKIAATGGVAAGAANAENAQFQSVLAEAEERKGKSRQWRMKNPPSAALSDYTKSQILPGLGTMAQGALQATAETLDYVNPVNLTRLALDPADEGLSRFFSPPVAGRYVEAVSPVVDYGLLDDRDPLNEERRKAFLNAGALFSPL